MKNLLFALFFTIIIGLNPSQVFAEVWANDPFHNMVHRNVEDVPVHIDDDAIIWQQELASRYQYPMPEIVGDRVYHGADGKATIDPLWQKAVTRGGTFTCRDLKDGEPIWQLVLPLDQYLLGNYGVCTTPLIQGDKIYVFALDEILCLDANGMADGNQGYQEELAMLTNPRGFKLPEGETMPTEIPQWSADVLWRFSLSQFPINYQDATSCSMVDYNGQLWVSTSHDFGTESRGWEPEIAPPQRAPYIIVLDKETGELIAKDNMDIPYILHGNWSSPSLMKFDNGDAIIIWPDGYGQINAFAIPEKEEGEVQILENLWTWDANLPEWRHNEEGKPYAYTIHTAMKGKYPKEFVWEAPEKFVKADELSFQQFMNFSRLYGPNEFIGMPTVDGNRVYASLGRDCYYSSQRPGEGEERLPGKRQYGQGRLVCLEIDPVTKQPELIWDDLDMGRSQCTPSLYNGMLFIADTLGFLNCYDQDTGELLWKHDLGAKVTCRSQIVIDGKVYVTTDQNEYWVLEASKTPKVLANHKMKSAAATVESADGLLLIATTKGLTLYGNEKRATE